jgi:hypothetical protein
MPTPWAHVFGTDLGQKRLLEMTVISWMWTGGFRYGRGAQAILDGCSCFVLTWTLMVYRKGEITGATIDRDYPHQVALPADTVQLHYWAIEDFCRGRSRAPRGHSVFHDDQWWHVSCFADPDDAQAFGSGSEASRSIRRTAGAVRIGRAGTDHNGH